MSLLPLQTKVTGMRDLNERNLIKVSLDSGMPFPFPN